MILVSRSQLRSIRKLLPLLEVRKLHLCAAIFLGIVSLGSAIGLAAVSAWLIARASQMPPVMSLNVAVTSVRALGISKALFRYFERLASHHVALAGVVALRVNIYRRVAELKADTLARYGRGQLLNRVTSDVDAIGDLVVRVFHPFMVAVLTALLTVGGIYLLCPPAAIWLAVGLLFSIAAGTTLSARATRNALIASVVSEEKITGIVSELLTHDAEINALGKRSYYRRLLNVADHEFQMSTASATRATSLASAADNFGLGIALIGCTLAGAAAVSAGSLSQVGLAVVVLTPLAAFEGTALLPNAASSLVRCAIAAERLTALLDAESEATSVESSDDFPQSDEIRAKGLSIGWNDAQVILDALDLVINNRTKIAVVGPSGIGKTTMLLTLSGMLAPLAGTVLHSGLNGTDLPASERAKLVTFTPEDAHIFGTSIYENVRVGNPQLTVSQCEELLKRVHLGEWLRSLPQGIHTPLTSAGSNISGGERRRILVARALASDSPLLLLDEPGEHLDAQTSDALIRDLASISERGTVIVTHRLSALTGVDRVILLDYDPHFRKAVIAFSGTLEAAQKTRFVGMSLENE